MKMKQLALFVLSASLAIPTFADSEGVEIGSVSYKKRLVGSNDRIVIDRFDDPMVSGISCYVSNAVKGGIGGAIGTAEDTSDASVSCRQTGVIDFEPDSIPEKENVFNKSRSLAFKELSVIRFHDQERSAFIYLTYTGKLINGSPKNTISVVVYNKGQNFLSENESSSNAIE